MTAWQDYMARQNRQMKQQYGDPFFYSQRWLEVRYRVLQRSNGACQCCGHRAAADNPLQVDHIKPRSKYPELQLDPENLQVLCRHCNLGKGNWDETDWRWK